MSGTITNLADNLKLGPWAWGLQQASWRGIPFVVRASEVRRGRRVAVHEYPFRDEVWVEDLGRGTRNSVALPQRTATEPTELHSLIGGFPNQGSIRALRVRSTKPYGG